VTGNLNFATARALGITSSAGGEVVGAGGAAVTLSANDAATVRRAAQSILAQERVDLRISSSGRLSAGRAYSAADLESWFALSAFTDNAMLYEALVRASGNSDGTANAGKALIAAARRVSAALNAGVVSTAVRDNWSMLQGRLRALDPTF